MRDTQQSDSAQSAAARQLADTNVLRQVLEVLALLGIAVSMFRTFAAEGYMISTGSMAPTLLGFHNRVICPDCEFPFAMGVSVNNETNTLQSTGFARCPNCGLRPIDVSKLHPTEGDQLLVHKNIYDFRDPRRWEVVIFRNPQNLSQAYVKRVVGLPGEEVLIDNGEILIDGKIARKPWSVHRATRIPVSDTNFPVKTESGRLSSQWQFSENSGWSKDGTTFQFSSNEKSLNPHWLSYHHRDVTAGVVTNEVADHYGYNRLSANRSRYIVDDLALRCEFQFHGKPRRLCLKFNTHNKTPECMIILKDGTADVYVLGFETPSKSYAIPDDLFDQAVTLEASLVDRQLFVAINNELLGTPVETGRYEPDNRGKTADEAEIGAEEQRRYPLIRLHSSDSDLTINRLQVFRDVYYTPKDSKIRSSRESVQLGPGEFFVLGDNSPNSVDSRNWTSGSVTRNLLIGKPLVVHLPSQTGKIRLGDTLYHMRLPDVSRIRLIH